MGLKDLAVLSEAEVFFNPKWFRKPEEKLVKVQRKTSIIGYLCHHF